MRRAKLRRREIYLRREVEPARLSGLLLYEHGDVLIKKIDHQHHAAEKQPVKNAVEKRRDRVQVVDGVNGGAVQRQVHQHGDEKNGKRPVQRRMLFLRREVHIGDKGGHKKQGDLHPQHGRLSFFMRYTALS